jgi:cyclic dehypoxanthinyl futalosine synthase
MVESNVMPDGTLERIVAKADAGGRLDAAEALRLYREAPTTVLGRLADAMRARKHPERIVTYIIDRNVNYTNVCVARCNFCAFYRPVGHGDGYVLSFDEIFRKIDETIAVGGEQLLLQGGHNPDLPLDWYEDLFRAVKARYPSFKLHALSPSEVLHISRLSRLSTPEVIARLIDAGLDSIPGGGAEILVDRVRKLLNCYSKSTADEWLRIMGEAHDAGLRTTATMMSASSTCCGYGSCRIAPAASPRSSPGAISRSTRSSACTKRLASTICGRWRWPGSSSTTSTTCRPRG